MVFEGQNFGLESNFGFLSPKFGVSEVKMYTNLVEMSTFLKVLGLKLIFHQNFGINVKVFQFLIKKIIALIIIHDAIQVTIQMRYISID